MKSGGPSKAGIQKDMRSTGQWGGEGGDDMRQRVS